jgi:predicted porin
MTKTFKYALTAVLGVGMIAPAFAQDNFPDVPETHWAFEALARLKKDGLLVGYPDGLFRGSRPASRYELAVAVHAAYTNLRNVTDGLQSQIDALKAGNPDIQSLRDAVTALQAEVNTMKGYGDDLANLRKLADTFQTELHALGVDVDQMKKDLGDLGRRVSALEAKKPTISISGDANLFLAAANSSSNDYGISKDGRILGEQTDKAGNPTGTTAGLSQNLSVLHEIGVTFTTTNTTGPTATGTVVIGNALSGLGNESTANLSPSNTGYGGTSGLTVAGTPYTDNGNNDIYIQDLEVNFKSSIAGLAFNAEVGRVGYKVSPYILQRVNPNSYFSTDRSANGEYYIDGGIVGFNVGPAKLDVVFGRTSNLISSDGVNVNPLQSGGFGGPLGTSTSPATVLGIDRTLGVDASVPLGNAGSVKLAYLWMDSDPTDTNGDFQRFSSNNVEANRLNVYGGTVNFGVGKLKLSGDYAKSDLMLNTTTVNDSKDYAWNAKAAIGFGKLDLYGLYRNVEADFIAPGDWGRIGIWRNPTNIKGYTGGAAYKFTPALSLDGSWEHEEGIDSGFEATSGFGTGTKLDKYEVNLGYHFTPNLQGMVGYENDKFSQFTGVAGNDPLFQWTTFGLAYGLSEATKLTLQYELNDTSNLTYFGGNSTYRGGLLTSQLTVKF